MEQHNKTTEEVVREVVGRDYDKFGFQDNTKLIADIVAILDDKNPSLSAVVNEDTASYAATEIRNMLWEAYSGGGASANATGNLFVALGRNEELGWLDEHLG